MSRKKKTEECDGDEVDMLLRAAEDEIVLKLSINSHMSRGRGSYIDPDLDRRFQALKSSSKASNSKATADNEDDDLFAKFSALKSSLPSTSSVNHKRPNKSNDEDEVQKVIQWAMDAARLDPSPPSDTGDDDDIDSYDDDSDDDGEKKGRPK
uniref:Uncharacterized protein n=1 Tax=Davidia involucrata TaxID=16924 RepID=A0A5B7C1T8_DAVIN